MRDYQRNPISSVSETGSSPKIETVAAPKGESSQESLLSWNPDQSFSEEIPGMCPHSSHKIISQNPNVLQIRKLSSIPSYGSSQPEQKNLESAWVSKVQNTCMAWSHHLRHRVPPPGLTESPQEGNPLSLEHLLGARLCALCLRRPLYRSIPIILHDIWVWASTRGERNLLCCFAESSRLVLWLPWWPLWMTPD